MTDKLPTPIVPAEGWHVLHLFYKVEQAQWSLFSQEEQFAAKTRLTELIAEIRATEKVQLLTFAMVSPKADLGFMLLGADLHTVNAFEKRLSNVLGADVLTPTFSYLSMTERSEYTTSAAEHTAQLTEWESLQAGRPEHEVKMFAFRQRMEKYLKDRLYPVLPPWPVVCFYPMSKRRGDAHNWYGVPFEERKKLLLGHAR